MLPKQGRHSANFGFCTKANTSGTVDEGKHRGETITWWVLYPIRLTRLGWTVCREELDSLFHSLIWTPTLIGIKPFTIFKHTATQKLTIKWAVVKSLTYQCQEPLAHSQVFIWVGYQFQLSRLSCTVSSIVKLISSIYKDVPYPLPHLHTVQLLNVLYSTVTN